MNRIYHVTTLAAWEAGKNNATFSAPSLQTEGFIHCCSAEQIAGVLQRYFKGKTGLVALEIDIEKLKQEIKYEPSKLVNEDFPHIYGPLNTDAVVGLQKLDS